MGGSLNETVKKKSILYKVGEMFPADWFLPISTQRSVNKFRKNIALQEKELRKAFYNEYILSPEWREKRNLVRQRAKGICEKCKKANIERIHHLTYVRLGKELLSDLLGLCKNCHKNIHWWDHESWKRKIVADNRTDPRLAGGEGRG